MTDDEGRTSYGAGAGDSVAEAYEAYRRAGKKGWGLAWYLSTEVCRRYYISHGIAPFVIEHSGLGYYGIQLEQLKCVVNRTTTMNDRPLGRFTMTGDVENWRTGEPGDHGCELFERAMNGADLSSLVQSAIRHLDLPPVPATTHTHCHHKRRGQSYVLLWEAMALIALRREGRVQLWDHAFHTADLAKRYDPEYATLAAKAEPPDYFLFEGGKSRVLVRGDGQVILPTSSGSLWERYMRGESVGDLARWIEAQL